MNVLVIPEDFRKDQYMLKPIISAMMKKLGNPRAKVKICPEDIAELENRINSWVKDKT